MLRSGQHGHGIELHDVEQSLAIGSGGSAGPADVPPANRPPGEARALRTSDIPQVADLFVRTFDPRGSITATLLESIEQVFFNHPWQDDGLSSQVIANGDDFIAGFIGVLPQRLSFHGRAVRAVTLGPLMARDAERNPLVGAKLFRAALKGGQQLSYSDTTNARSLALWQKSGGVLLAPYSLAWIRVLRPLTHSAAKLAMRLPSAAALVRPASVADGLLHRITPALLPQESAARGFDCDPDEFAAAVPALCERYAVRPLWDQATLKWLLRHAAIQREFGAATMRLVQDRRGRVAGAYFYHARPRGIMNLLQMLAMPGAEQLVVDELVAHAHERGFAAARGIVQPEFLYALVCQRSYLVRGPTSIVHTRESALLAPLLGNEGLIAGLAGEGWSPLNGGIFS